ncbi:MAG TPA: deoxyribose-phosphate aldolase [Candidatus Limnocylindria bacterium]|jgi:deoxyribose-phosphate aldolase|nr:deoxyribose-phosphate aldolase [Candidatus Limnocylindria bacterium]
MTAIGRRAARLEHRLTRPNASLAELEAAVQLAVEHDCAALTVNPWLVKAARRALGRSRLRLGTIIGSPAGTQILAVKAFEASKALEQGANQIDFVLNGGALLSEDDEIVFNDMLAVVDMAHSALAVAGVVVESEPMTADQVSRACRIAERAGADYVITSAGDLAARRTVQRTALLRDSVGPRVQVKASGRFHTLPDVRAAVAAGATRISAEFSADLLGAASASLAPLPEPIAESIAPTSQRPRAVASRAS